MGIIDVEVDEYGYVYVILFFNVLYDVFVICYCSYMDIFLDSSGINVKFIVYCNY